MIAMSIPIKNKAFSVAFISLRTSLAFLSVFVNGILMPPKTYQRYTASNGESMLSLNASLADTAGFEAQQHAPALTTRTHCGAICFIKAHQQQTERLTTPGTSVASSPSSDTMTECLAFSFCTLKRPVSDHQQYGTPFGAEESRFGACIHLLLGSGSGNSDDGATSLRPSVDSSLEFVLQAQSGCNTYYIGKSQLQTEPISTTAETSIKEGINATSAESTPLPATAVVSIKSAMGDTTAAVATVTEGPIITQGGKTTSTPAPTASVSPSSSSSPASTTNQVTTTTTTRQTVTTTSTLPATTQSVGTWRNVTNCGSTSGPLFEYLVGTNSPSNWDTSSSLCQNRRRVTFVYPSTMTDKDLCICLALSSMTSSDPGIWMVKSSTSTTTPVTTRSLFRLKNNSVSNCQFEAVTVSSTDTTTTAYPTCGY